MTIDPAVAGEPLQLQLPRPDSGLRAAMLHLPRDGAVKSVFVHAHALADEMNKSRRMVAWASRELAQAGCAVLRVDLAGCGDSPGDFADATWARWVDDLLLSLQLLPGLCTQRACRIDSDAPTWLWGLRAGALLAGAAAQRAPQRCNLLLWQPITQGRTQLRQFLRLAAGGRRALGGQAASLDQLRQQLEGGAPVDVAGYTISPALAAGMEAATLQPPQPHARAVWLEVSARAEPELAAASRGLVERWAAEGQALHARCVAGPSFWEAVEIEDAPELIAATLAACRPDMAEATAAS